MDNWRGALVRAVVRTVDSQAVAALANRFGTAHGLAPASEDRRDSAQAGGRENYLFFRLSRMMGTLFVDTRSEYTWLSTPVRNAIRAFALRVRGRPVFLSSSVE